MPADLSPPPGITHVLAKLKKVRRNGIGYAACCPAHDDKTPSLMLRETEDGHILMHCHSGCTFDAIVAATGLARESFFPGSLAAGGLPQSAGRAGPGREIATTYDYTDESGTLLYQVVRYIPKDFRPRRLNGKGGWTWSLGDTRRVLFHLPQLRAAIAAGQTIYLAEGEKDVLSLETAGVVATTNVSGAKSWRPEYAETLRGAHLVILRDKDEAGAKRVETVFTAIRGVAATIRVMESAVGNDATDHLLAGKTVDQLVPVPLPGAPPALIIRRASEVVAKPATYLWRPWLPRSSYVDLGGDPGAGKTFLAVELASCATRGEWPGGVQTDPVSVVFLATEDSLEVVLKPRLEAAGAVMKRITFIEGAPDPNGGMDDIVLVRDYANVLAHIRTEGAGMVYFDAIVDVLPEHDGKGYNESRRATRLLPRLAHDSGAVVLATRHMKKSGDGTAWKNSVGSVGYASRARVMLQVYEDREDEGRRILCCAKHNTAAKPASFAFRLEGGTESSPPHLGWIGEDHRSANQLAAEAAKVERETPAKDRARTWLAQRLAAGPAERETLFAEAEAAGLSRSTVYNAATEIDVIKETERPVKFGDGWRSHWRLPARPIEPIRPTQAELGRMELSPSPITADHSSKTSLDEWSKTNGKTNGEGPCPRCGNADAIRDPAGAVACPGCDPIGFARAFKARRDAA